MTWHTSVTPSDLSSDAFDLSQIFIAREQQIDLFNLCLNRWKQLVFDAEPDDTLVMTAPSLYNKIQGLMVLLYGRGGFGKSTLLKHYHDIAEDDRHLITSKIVDWEFAVEGKRGIFTPPQGQEVDASEYYRVLCSQLAIALNKKPKEFREYQSTVKDIEKARKQVSGVLDRLRNDDRFAPLRGVTIDALVTIIGALTPPPFSRMLDNKKVKEVANQGVKIGIEQLAEIRSKLHDELGHKLDDYLDYPLRLGLALGRDLYEFAKNFPLLIFFDTYEEVASADHLLRTVMGAAGLRLGWVMAGRDNLWGGSEQHKRSIAIEYGYKEIVPADRGLSVNFNAGDIGAFTLSDIREYFGLIREKVPYEPPLPEVTEENAERILDVTQGVPLAVKIAAGLYLEMGNLETVTEDAEGKREIVDGMVRRYLLHTRADQSEKVKLYGLAMLRRADQPSAVAAALGLAREEARTSFANELSLLHRRYSFIFTEKAQPSLHQEVRHFLRLWLLEHRRDPEIEAVNERLKEAHEAALKELEEGRQYSSLKERLEDDEWIGVYLDLTEQQFWIDPAKGVRYALPFLIVGAYYRNDIDEEIARIGKFFENHIKTPYRNWWHWAMDSFASMRESEQLSIMAEIDREMNKWRGLEELTKVASQGYIAFPVPLPKYQEELEALLWWNLADAYQEGLGVDECYEKALSRLHEESELRSKLKAAAARYYEYAAWLCMEDEAYNESIALLNRALELNPENASCYSYRGLAYSKLKKYEHALQDYNFAVSLDPHNATIYVNRGKMYSDIKDHEKALHDYNRAIELDSDFARAYCYRGKQHLYYKAYKYAVEDTTRAIKLGSDMPINYFIRGLAFLHLKDAQKARADFKQYYNIIERSELKARAAWLWQWAGMSKLHLSKEATKRLEQIAAIAPQSYVALVCRGVALGLEDKLKQGLIELDRAISLEQEDPDAYFWKGMLCAYYYQGREQLAREAIEKALTLGLPPILLTPLYWLEKDRPNFFEKYASSLLEQYRL